ncbi:thioether cross-link-forming SCIFF peptide maturase [Clostridium sp. 'deep sea']|uniref:thioether cross-link-forming SCIFF peptide maturase n=1 Tax=Clostridium sp. 'deep sea' TaxID=2779445 RepID=UPI001896456F|nr:thioether cross-link-forming SCIFF peptide maturase [Clostridium sp. 'deep sea']QOR36149.1 thioether cross-link-forming SCIFF peptide maturase [Clostridium sp. 'deep sea']
MQVHVFNLKDEYFVLDVGSGVLHQIDKLAAEVIKGIQENKPNTQIINELNQFNSEDVLDVINEVNSLRENNLLFSKDALSEYHPELSDTVVKALCLHIAHDCNMRCKYCFAETGEYKVGKREFMSFEVGKNAVDLLVRQSFSRTNLEIDFFGGEPLMSFEIIKQVFEYAQEQAKLFNKNIRYTITTNGILLNDNVIDFVNENNIQLIMSHDGRKEVHDKMRPLIGGKSSYDLVTKKFKNALEKGVKDYHARGTFTTYNTDFTTDVKHLLDIGFKYISFEPVVTDPADDYALGFDKLQQIKNEYEKLAEFYYEQYKKGKPFTFFHYEVDLNQGPCLAKRLTGCGAGFDYMAIAPNGDIYPCHQFVGLPEFKVGTVFEKKLNKEISQQFLDAHIFNKPECKECWARYYCSGGCHADAFYRNNDLYKPVKFSCELTKKRLECALAIKALIASNK